MFDPSNPGGKHLVDLGTAYGQMVADECFYLANYRAGVTVKKMEYASHRSHPFEKVDLVADCLHVGFNLEEFKSSAKGVATLILETPFKEVAAADALIKLLRIFSFRMIRKFTVPIVKLVRENWNKKLQDYVRCDVIPDELCEVLLYEVFFALFLINDEDCSNTIDVEEFVQTIDSLGMKITEDDALRLMHEFDKDSSGMIDASEFSAILVEEFCRTDTPKGRLMDARTMKPWVIPNHGFLKVDIEVVCDAPSMFDVGQNDGVISIIDAMKRAKTEEQKELIFDQAVNSPYHFMNAEQGQLLLEELAGTKSKRKIKTSKLYELVGKILPQIVSAEQCCKFLHNNLNDALMLGVRLEMGQMFSAFTGLATGHYTFDCGKRWHLMLLRKLVTIANTEMKFCRDLRCDTSQHGNYSHFRNERLDGEW